jgi:hypothetical protein
MTSAAPARRFFAAPFRAQTYRSLAYLALAFPLGLAYFVGLTVGVSLGLGLFITLVGIPILIATLAGATVVAGFEAHLVKRLLGVEANSPELVREFDSGDKPALPGDGMVDSAKRLVTAPSTWTSVALVLTKFVFGLVSFVALTVTATLGAVMLAAPFVYDGTPGWVGVTESQYRIGSWTVETLPEAVAVAAAGVVFAFVALNLLNGFAALQARYTAALLGDGDSA